MSIVQHLLSICFFIVILFGPIPLCSLGFILNKKQNEEQKSSHFILVCLTVWCAIETCISLFLGMIHSLNLSSVLVSEIALFVAGLIFCINSPFRKQLFEFHKLIRTSNINQSELVIIVFTSFIGFLLLGKTLLRPITDYDSLVYHLPAMAKWYQTSSFTILDEFRFDEIGRYPYNWEALCSLFLMPFHEDFLVAFPNLVAWIILGLSIYLISIEIGATKISSIASSSLVLSLPILIENVNTMHVDLPFASFFMVGLYFTILYNRTLSSAHLGLFIIVLGMLCGIKTSGILYVFLLLLVLAVLAIISTLKSHVIFPILKIDKNTFLIICFGIFGFLFLGCFWYLRNLVELGNPLGYLKVQFGSFTILHGTLDPTLVRKTTLANLFILTNLEHWKILGGQIRVQLGIPFLIMVLQILVSFLLIPISTTNKKRIRNRSLIDFILLLIVTGFLYWTTPYSGDNGVFGWQITPWIGQGLRYAFPFLGVLGVVTAVITSYNAEIINRISIKYKKIIIITLGINTISSVANILEIKSYNYSITKIILFISLALFILLILKLLNSQQNYNLIEKLLKNRWSLLILSILLITISTFGLRQIRDIQRVKVYGEAFKYIETKVSQNEKIGYLLTNRGYIFYGKELNRKAVFVSAKSDNLPQWLDSLHTRGVDVVAVGPVEVGQTSKELSWLEDTNGPFIRVSGQDYHRESVLYRFRSHS